MENMICYECVLKHLSAALSYGKEIISGHGKGADLDHRPDYLGQIVNCEHHLQLIDKNLFDEISTYRKELQAKKIEISQEDLSFIRKIYNEVQLKEDGINTTASSYTQCKINPDIVYLNVKNREYFQFSYNMLKKNLVNYNNIYVISPEADLSGIDVQIVNEKIDDFIKRQQLSQDFIIMYENTTFIRNVDAKTIPTTFSMKINDNIKILKQMKKLGIQSKIQIFDNIKAQIVNKKILADILSVYSGEYILTAYFLINQQEKRAPDNLLTVNVNRPICCSTKSNLKLKHFVSWNEKGFNSLVDYFKK